MTFNFVDYHERASACEAACLLASATEESAAIHCTRVFLHFSRGGHPPGWSSAYLRVRAAPRRRDRRAIAMFVRLVVRFEGDHALLCGRGFGRNARHGEINKRIYIALAFARVLAVLEPVGLDVDDGQQPDRVTVLILARTRDGVKRDDMSNLRAHLHLRKCREFKRRRESGRVDQKAEVRANLRLRWFLPSWPRD